MSIKITVTAKLEKTGYSYEISSEPYCSRQAVLSHLVTGTYSERGVFETPLDPISVNFRAFGQRADFDLPGAGPQAHSQEILDCLRERIRIVREWVKSLPRFENSATAEFESFE